MADELTARVIDMRLQDEYKERDSSSPAPSLVTATMTSTIVNGVVASIVNFDHVFKSGETRSATVSALGAVFVLQTNADRTKLIVRLEDKDYELYKSGIAAIFCQRDGDGVLIKQWDDKYVFEGSDGRAEQLLTSNPPEEIRSNLFVMDMEAPNERIVIQMLLPFTTRNALDRVSGLMFV